MSYRKQIRPRLSNKTLYIADIEADIPPRETSQKERQKFKNNHFVFLKNISYTLESIKVRLFNRKESHSKSSPIVQSNCPVQLSRQTVQSRGGQGGKHPPLLEPLLQPPVPLCELSPASRLFSNDLAMSRY